MHKREQDFERRFIARVKRECAGGDDKGGSQTAMAPPTPALPPPDSSDSQALTARDNAQRRMINKRGAGATMLTGVDGAKVGDVNTASLGGGTQMLLG